MSNDDDDVIICLLLRIHYEADIYLPMFITQPYKINETTGLNEQVDISYWDILKLINHFYTKSEIKPNILETIPYDSFGYKKDVETRINNNEKVYWYNLFGNNRPLIDDIILLEHKIKEDGSSGAYVFKVEFT